LVSEEPKEPNRSNNAQPLPLSEVRKTLRVDWYRSRIKHSTLRELSKRSDLQGWFQAGGHVGLWMITGAITYLFWYQQNWLGFILTLFTHGTITSFFAGVAPHELGHGTVFRTKWLNTVFLYLTSFISWYDHVDYNTSHTYHHRYTLHPEGDREVLLPMKPTVGKTFLIQLFTINLLTKRGRTIGKGGLLSNIYWTIKSALGSDKPHEWMMALHSDQPDQHVRSIYWSRILVTGHGFILIFAIATGQWVLPIIVSVAPFIANWASYSVGMTQHTGLMDKVPDFRKSVRSIKINPVHSFLYWRMNWHTEHHMYAGVPCYNLKRLYKEIADDMPEPRSLIGAWREMWDTWNRQQIDPEYQFDTPLPATAKLSNQNTPTELEASIGDIAPKGLK
tara:strand:- start:261 stop:1433 length:1173 start_codon:yes stop_codon:yes gene_type:complete